MSQERLEALEQMVEQNPGNTFARYGLAMEYSKAGQPQRAIEQFRQLIAADPDYAAAYYHGGRALESLGRADEAREMYEKGIEVTTRTGDAHTRSELQAALDIVGL